MAPDNSPSIDNRPHPNAFRPAGLRVDVADHPGAVDTDVQFISDRLALLDHVLMGSKSPEALLVRGGARWR
jgi:hypothetical protein